MAQFTRYPVLEPPWDPQATLELYPQMHGFTCVGTTLQGRRCRNSFIQRLYLREADDILQQLPAPDYASRDQTSITRSLKRVAWLTLCPRWHQRDPLQLEEVVNKWLTTILQYNPQVTPATIPYNSLTQLPARPEASTTSRDNLPNQIVSVSNSSQSPSAASRARSHWASTYVAPRSAPSDTATAPADVRRSSASRLPGELAASSSQPISTTPSSQPTSVTPTVPAPSPTTIQINLNITISNHEGRRHSNTRGSSQRTATNSPDPYIHPSRHGEQANPVPGGRTSSRYSSGSIPRSHIIMVNTTTASFGELLSRIEALASRLSPPHSPHTSPTRDSDRARRDARSPAPSTPSYISPVLATDAWPFPSPPLSPVPIHPPGTLSISTDSETQSQPLAAQRSIYTPSSSGLATPVLISPPASPLPEALIAPQSSQPSVVAAVQERAVRRQPLDECYVCREFIADAHDSTWCRGGCGQNLHIECFEQWTDTQLQYRDAILCAYCRTPWVF